MLTGPIVVISRQDFGDGDLADDGPVQDDSDVITEPDGAHSVAIGLRTAGVHLDLVI